MMRPMGCVSPCPLSVEDYARAGHGDALARVVFDFMRVVECERDACSRSRGPMTSAAKRSGLVRSQRDPLRRTPRRLRIRTLCLVGAALVAGACGRGGHAATPAPTTAPQTTTTESQDAALCASIQKPV